VRSEAGEHCHGQGGDRGPPRDNRHHDFRDPRLRRLDQILLLLRIRLCGHLCFPRLMFALTPAYTASRRRSCIHHWLQVVAGRLDLESAA
jgi:hypothetical protein